jgi:hypothetical protein
MLSVLDHELTFDVDGFRADSFDGFGIEVEIGL